MASAPWLDWLTTPRQQVYDQLAGQRHRRFIKTHTPLDGVPIEAGVSYIVVARHPLDMAVSLYHHGDNIDRERLRQLTGAPPSSRPPESSDAPGARPPLHSWLVRWIERDCDPRAALNSLPGVLWHLADAWQRREQPNVLLVHYDDLLTDLGGQMRRLAAWLGITVPDQRWPVLVDAATFAAMRRRAGLLVPDPSGVLKDHQAFFRQGRSGAGRELLTVEEAGRYHRRAAQMAPPDLLACSHRSAPSFLGDMAAGSGPDHAEVAPGTGSAITCCAAGESIPRTRLMCVRRHQAPHGRCPSLLPGCRTPVVGPRHL